MRTINKRWRLYEWEGCLNYDSTTGIITANFPPGSNDFDLNWYVGVEKGGKVRSDVIEAKSPQFPQWPDPGTVVLLGNNIPGFSVPCVEFDNDPEDGPIGRISISQNRNEKGELPESFVISDLPIYIRVKVKVT